MQKIKFGLAVLLAPTLAFSQLMLPPPVSTPSVNGPINMPKASSTTAQQVVVKRVQEPLEPTRAGAGEFGYPAATDTAGFGLGDSPELIQRNAARMGLSLKEKNEYRAEFGLPSRIAFLSFGRPWVNNPSMQDILQVRFTSSGASRALIIYRTEAFEVGVATEALQAQMVKKYGEPSFVSADKLSVFTWKSNIKGRIQGGGAQCEPPSPSAAQSSYKDTNCRFGVSIWTQRQPGNERVAISVSVTLADIAGFSSDYRDFNALVSQARNAEADKAKGVAVPKL